MYRNILILAAVALGTGGVFAQSNGERTFTGQIMDSSCAKAGSHQAMEKEHGLGNNARACTQACVKMGAKYVLYDPATRTTYALDNQKMPASLAGENATITGKLDSGTNTIHVRNVAPAT
jgi:hypothetical protein